MAGNSVLIAPTVRNGTTSDIVSPLSSFYPERAQWQAIIVQHWLSRHKPRHITRKVVAEIRRAIQLRTLTICRTSGRLQAAVLIAREMAVDVRNTEDDGR
jgi:hypothetical protein